MKAEPPFNDAEALQTRLGLRLAAVLNAPEAAPPHDISERLRVARDQAVARAASSRRTAAAPAAAPGSVMLGGSGRAALLGQPLPWWQRMAVVLPLLLLVGGLLAIVQSGQREQARDAADFDVVLLADDLPVLAYADPGFAEYLKTAQP